MKPLISVKGFGMCCVSVYKGLCGASLIGLNPASPLIRRHVSSIIFQLFREPVWITAAAPRNARGADPCVVDRASYVMREREREREGKGDRGRGGGSEGEGAGAGETEREHEGEKWRWR